MSTNDVCVEVKDGKLSLKQKSLRWDESAVTLRELLAFSDYFSNPDTSKPLPSIPNEYMPLIAKLTIESDKTIHVLSKNIKKTILSKCGAQEDKEALDDPRIPISVFSEAIQHVATRINYGVAPTPAALTIWRWEIVNPESTLADASTDQTCNFTVAQARKKDREEARDAFMSTYKSMTDDEKTSLLDKKKSAKTKSKPAEAEASSSKEPKTERAKSPTPKASSAPKEKKEAPITPAPKEPTKQRAMMQSFFKASTKKEVPDSKNGERSSADFERTFKPFLLRKGYFLAPINIFIGSNKAYTRFEKGKGRASEVIIVDDDGDTEMASVISEDSPTKVRDPPKAGEDLLQNFIDSVPPCRRTTRRSRPSDPKTKSSGSLCVRNLVARLNEAEVTDDVQTVRRLETLLKSRSHVPLKYIQFCDNVRPGYYGTWTKPSAFVGPRTPFAKDPVSFDYSYDSGEEWEDEPDDAEEVASVGDDEEESESVVEEDEFDGWLVGDDDIDFEEGAPAALSSRSTSPSTTSLTNGKRKLELESKEKEKEPKKRKVFKQLVPYIVGPHWEDVIGQTTDQLRPYCIQLLNDCPYPMDPFTFVSEDVPTTFVNTELASRTAAIGMSNGPKADTAFAIPALPPHLHPSSQINLPAPTTPDMTTLSLKKTAGPRAKSLKKPFPVEHIPRLLQLVEGSSLTKAHLIEELAQQFKANKEVKKYSIEGALMDHAARVSGIWKLKEETVPQQVNMQVS